MFSHLTLKTLVSALIITAISAMSLPALAVNDAMMDLLKILRDKGSLIQDEFELLQNAAKADEEKIFSAATDLEQKVDKVSEKMSKLTLKDKFKIESQDGAHSFQPIGRVSWDSVWEDNDGSDDVAGGSELRRARLGFQAQFSENWKVKLEYDFAGSDADLKDGWISYNNKIGGSKYNLKVGQHHVPFGFNTISSSKYMSFLRRPLYADGPLSPARQYGVALRMDGKRWLVHAGGFLDEPEDGEVNVDGDGEDARTLAIRVAGLPFFQDKTHLLHVGASYMNIDLRGDSLRVRQRSISHLDNSRMFDTGAFTAGVIDDVNAFDLEALVIYGPFHALGEYVMWDLDNADTGADGLNAWSFEAGWFLTGESMQYKAGQFSGVSPKKAFMNGGYGAWQIVARYESMDLNDGTTVGGDGDIVSIGVNWLPIKNVRFMATYNRLVDFDQPGDVNDGLEPASFSIRSMAYW
ncbi:MAG: porin [Gammaproteobacteria bacterium]|nr:porin [Gammaproteobacteria bacterium]